ncbi:N-methylhydantoinase A/oxoprolinase/acetone carboxylase beta subunit [Loktanella ponticola]|uniref:N-methylhydantoinase A/oxoprolinase/acetone carboxylase beta subunit n=1 Tax=Yoonia ponticola TaxID=1524255 RepID=A0A7W9EYQ9_9RHOB|nr:hydantoinase/oxoprolinase family protein [Yoonia ponticola]MBB5721121.1 N-methylhydantoinase A/oxoprolinase/acetone carboxylase beta subunit [Yoonia ponticola]
MAYLLGVDTGGTYTDAVILDEATDQIVASAKSLTTRPDLSQGVGAAMDTVLSGVDPADVALVSLSTTLATNALVEGQGGRVALILIGFEAAELERAGLKDALRGDPVVFLQGGHSHAGAELQALDLTALKAAMPTGVTGYAVAGSFATRNPAHEIEVRDHIRAVTDLPVTCSHELSSALGGPKRALTALLNARLIGMIDALITACETHMADKGINARLMVVRGDGALVSAAVAREKPIETILSGPAASIAGAAWLTGEQNALVSDIGGTTTDVCLLRDGRPQIDPQGARVGPYRTMVEAVAMRTTGLGGDSEVHVIEGLKAGLRLGPRRLMPIALAAHHYPDVVHLALDQALGLPSPAIDGGQIVIPLWSAFPQGLDPRETGVAERLQDGPVRYGQAVTTRMEGPALGRLVTRGLAMLAGVTPSDAAHVLGKADTWDTDAAEKALTLFARKRSGSGDRLAPDAKHLAQMIIDQLTAQTVDCLLDAAFAEDGRDWDVERTALSNHPLTKAGLDQHRGVIETSLKLGVPVIGLGASAASYYGAVGKRLNTRMVLPEYAGVANAIGAVVGQVAMHEVGQVTSNGPGHFAALGTGYTDKNTALAALETQLSQTASTKARAAGVEDIRLTIDRNIKEVTIENQPMFIEATIKVTAHGRPRIAVT